MQQELQIQPLLVRTQQFHLQRQPPLNHVQKVTENIFVKYCDPSLMCGLNFQSHLITRYPRTRSDPFMQYLPCLHSQLNFYNV
jgi:hypothetical protein